MLKSSCMLFLVMVLFTSTSIAGTYVVEVGDTLSGIAEKRDEKLASLKKLNPQIKNFNKIWPGQAIYTPSKKKDIKDDFHKKLACIYRPMQQRVVVISSHRSIVMKELAVIKAPEKVKANPIRDDSGDTVLRKQDTTTTILKMGFGDLPLQCPDNPFRYHIQKKRCS